MSVSLQDIKEVFDCEVLQEYPQEIQNELNKVDVCGKTYIQLMGRVSANDYYKRVDCEKWFCPKCGGLNGKIHKKRKRNIVDHFGGLEALKSTTLAQFVFTVPMELRYYFKNRLGLNSLFRMVKRVIEKEYGKERLVVYYLHIFGDKDYTYHPHINVHVKLAEKENPFLERSKLSKINEGYRKALEGYIREAVKVVDVQYSYRKGIRKVLHSKKYMARPIDGGALFKNNGDENYLRFLLIQMKRFRYLRTYGGKKQMREEENILKEIKEIEGVAGEPLMYVGVITASEFRMKFRDQDLERLQDGFYRVKQQERKKFKKRGR